MSSERETPRQRDGDKPERGSKQEDTRVARRACKSEVRAEPLHEEV